jgi:hypothetical protein
MRSGEYSKTAYCYECSRAVFEHRKDLCQLTMGFSEVTVP